MGNIASEALIDGKKTFTYIRQQPANWLMISPSSRLIASSSNHRRRKSHKILVSFKFLVFEEPHQQQQFSKQRSQVHVNSDIHRFHT
jgi:hypothetical protein